ncbi:thiamine pyrophosphate-dependent acetolactate synthase large subunit-like protein/nitrite reductase/ring-hydroxylating ferredoxin subunit [Aquimarina sp. EL_43]|uniref:thiamine pyrophosphate-binding protein n=1 Tax=unclassified Aquimarina TaxID=2627091 RepID=UPI0018CB83C9|nr:MULTISPECIES: thiamine pyrophosphate-binding protein [unclassified Aquimarina]MBG6130067.1 thiamine pyrophosphate-dependent acetolactate synthase large subunit-like protein/nitrite reductase/ring-hydroxylating ferredoxin subunit [Aquimarina sp. EL_35]MBG6148847.1 thiamine pyrophosphate-dependent acetolactate synthase large subunit-like protein/nitrite reductase/ring-hydroxylating ferredoxin subunit [Aquimarina sp. EL_32]MBG6168779.1 thiamine pyrophosphate-dependent acetolactate synthase large
MASEKEIVWYKVLGNKDKLPEGRVQTVTAGHQGICLTHFEGKFSALDNRCPHQGGPLGEGSIENGLLRCPWHGWDFDPCTGLPPGGYDDGVTTFDVKEEGNAIYVGIPEEPAHAETVSDIMIETMVNWGIDTVFGMVGHSNLGVADAMRRQEKEGKLRFFGIRHEGAAAFAASGYAKLTGKPAACFGIAGPGATNMFTGMWDAKVDRAPLLALSGQVNTQVVGTGAFQEVDLTKAFDSVAEFNHAVHQNSNHSELMSLAIKTALIKRDVSHLTFPDEVAFSKKPDKAKSQTPENRITTFGISPPKEMVNKASDMILSAKRPVIIVGHGARFNMAPIIDYAKTLNCPVITTFKGKGLIADDHELGCGVLGRSGTPIASWFMNESDLLIVFGASFSNHTGITPKKPIIQVDFDPMALSKFHKVDAALWGEISETLDILTKKTKGKTNTIDQKPEIEERWKLWKEEKQSRLEDSSSKGLSSIAVFDAMNRITPANAVIAVDVGNNTYSFGRYFEPQNQSILMSGYLGSIGFALPAAMGAWAAQGHERPIWSVSGDGGLGQYLAEISTLVKYNMNIKHVVLNNAELGKISKEQRAAELDVWQTSLHNPSFAAYAENCGALGIRVEKLEDLTPAMEKLRDHNGPALLEIITDVNLI